MSDFFKFTDLSIYILLIYLIAIPFCTCTNTTKNSNINVIVNKNVIAQISRNKDSIYQFPKFSIEVKSGKTRIIHSKCDDHLCEKQGWLDSTSNNKIICLPNKVIIRNNFSIDNIDEISE